MLHSLKRLLGSNLVVLDGELGPVKDFYFDVQTWIVRYLVADAGFWLSGRQVLISPCGLGSLTGFGKLSVMNRTRKQVENSPLIEADQSISRAYEEAYHEYYGWPSYWQSDALSGLSGSPAFPVTEPLPGEPITAAEDRPQERARPQLQRTEIVKGYAIRTSDGAKGHLCDFLIDKDWAIRQLVVKTGRRFSGQELEISAMKVDRISNEESTVFVSLSREALEQSPEHQSVPRERA
jgi:hypothetical protein